MRLFLLALACITLVSCKKEFGDNPEADILGVWYYIGAEDEDGVFTPYAFGRKAEYKFESEDGYKEYYTFQNGWNLEGPWHIRDDNKLYLDSDIDWKYIKFEDGKLKKAHWWGESPRGSEESWAVYEK